MQTIARLSVAFAASIAAAGICAEERKADPHVKEIPASGRIPMTIEGREFELYSSPGMPSHLYVARETAAALFGEGAKIEPQKPGGGLFSVQRVTAVRIGPVRIDGDRGKVSAAFGANPPEQREVRWFETDVYPGLEAAGGPFALPQDVVRYRLRATREGEVTSTLPLAGKSRWWIATTPVKIGGRTAFVGFAPQFENTVTSAALGALIAREGDGSFSGTSDPVTISHGAKRPVRIVALAKPFRLGSVSLNSILVRTTDYGNADEIPDPQEMADDAEQIVVRGRAKRRKPLYLGYIGQDYLKHCSWIEFDKARKTITLSCIAS